MQENNLCPLYMWWHIPSLSFHSCNQKCYNHVSCKCMIWYAEAGDFFLQVTYILHIIFLSKFHISPDSPFLAFKVFLQSVEKMPSVQSLVATSNLPNIWGAVMALGFIFISLWGAPQSPMAFISRLIQQVLPAPLGPRVIIPCRTLWVS